MIFLFCMEMGSQPTDNARFVLIHLPKVWAPSCRRKA